MNRYDIGDMVVCSVAFDVDDTPTDPTTLVFELRAPGGAVTTYTYGTDDEVVRDSVGRFHVHWPAALVGLHLYRWVGTGAAHGAEAGRFMVRENGF